MQSIALQPRIARWFSSSLLFMAERTLGLLAAIGMFAFSVFIYLKTGDWVAGVFVLGSLGYFVFFLLHYKRKNQ